MYIMAKNIVILICVATAVLSVDGMSPEEKEKAILSGAECSKQFPLDDAELEKVKNKELPSSENGKCLIACIMRKLDMMDENGMVLHENLTALAQRQYHDNPDLLKTNIDSITECTTEGDQLVSDGVQGCERAYNVLACIHQKVPNVSDLLRRSIIGQVINDAKHYVAK